jgi:HD superfamily phosphohydrolase YqeK
MYCTTISTGNLLDRDSGIRLHTTAEEKEVTDKIIYSKDTVSPAEKSNNNGEPVVTVMRTGTEAEQAEYVSRMIYYYINTGQVRFSNYTILF